MRILFIAPYIPSRIRVRPFQIIKGLARRHEVHVLVLGGSDKTDNEGVEEAIAAARSFQVVPHSKLRGYFQSLVALPTPHPMCTAFCWSRAMNKVVQDCVRNLDFDIVHVEHLRAAHFAPMGGHAPVVCDAVDCLTGLFRQMAGRRRNPLARCLMLEEAWKLARYEPRMLRGFASVMVTSESEKTELQRLDAGLSVQVVPNGVDTEYFSPSEIERHPRRVVFSGKMSYHPNAEAAVWFGENVFPELAKRWPDVEYVVVGSGPTAEVKQLASTPGISVTGYVDDIRPHLAGASVAVVPMQIAVGIQNKVLESMAMALPVVASPAAARALDPNCPGVVVADGVDSTVEAVSAFLDCPERALAVGAQGREAAISQFSWESSLERIEDIYHAALDGRQA